MKMRYLVVYVKYVFMSGKIKFAATNVIDMRISRVLLNGVNNWVPVTRRLPIRRS